MAYGIALGGEIDSVNRVRNLPHPLFPRLTVPKIKGVYLDIPPVVGTYSAIITCDKPVEFVDASLACSGYLHPDYWELSVDGYKLMETIYTKELPQTVYGGTLGALVYPIDPNKTIQLDFVNDSATSKQVWFDIKFLLAPKDISTATINIITV